MASGGQQAPHRASAARLLARRRHADASAGVPWASRRPTLRRSSRRGHRRRQAHSLQAHTSGPGSTASASQGAGHRRGVDARAAPGAFDAPHFLSIAKQTPVRREEYTRDGGSGRRGSAEAATCSFDSSRDVCSARCCWTAPWMATGASPLFAAICGARPGDLQLTVVPGRLVVALTDDSTAQRCMTAVVGPGPRSDRRTKLCLSVQTNKQHMGVCDKGRYSLERSSPLALARSDCSMFRAKRVEELLKLAARGPTVQARPMGCSDNCLVPPPGPELRPAFCPTVRHSCDSKPPGASLD